MPTKPWHSKLKGTKVHHNNPKCTLGNNIETRNIKGGTGGKRLCGQCRGRNTRRK